MTGVVVTDSGNTYIVSDVGSTKVITSGMLPPPAVNNITNSADVDLSNLADGGVLVYDAISQLWVATNRFEKQVFEAGEY